MTNVVSATQARENFAEIINRVYYSGEEFVIQKQGKTTAIIRPPKAIKTKNKNPKKKMTGIEFLLKLSKYNAKGLPKDLAQNHDKYAWE